ncbi:Glycosyl hydrolases family 38 N-terminal domain-containing protein [Nakamurella panacisegetis]|uniref:Glycosyl hydrolases family 38 N-terminal domain-containing protein n=1 Tax=Nakamurella panacisegetis TaxID=1090615 RepID=A0A1H0IY58_9ACTN|nr:glycoside hydrolase family 38 C-terminal domain-containing protein [Nakamurella panacisegetis]SDO36434.1 Glycosyl hydrolases family 38 N-terminal domain-containing protein [Nakamurella panacisegetis]
MPEPHTASPSPTRPPLISAQPWSHEDARSGLIDRALAATGTIGGHRVRLLPEPLRKNLDGVEVQAVRVLFDDTDTAGRALGLRMEIVGRNAVAGLADAPDGTSIRILVPIVTEATPATLLIPGLGEGAVEFILRPQRAWSVHVVHHSHFDFGYTDPQASVIASQRSYLDTVMDLADASADWPDEARFRWNVEALWAFSDWERHRPQAQVDKFVQLVKDGRVGLSAMPYNLHTDTCSTDELHELLREARRIRERYGIDFTTAMQTDVPGQVAGLPDALSDVGVKYLAVAHNWAGRSQPHTSGALNLPRLFRWKTPAGNSVVVWMTDSPHGLAYMEGPMVGFTESYESVDALFPAYLTALATRGYPFPPGVFGAHGERTEGRDGYPWEVLHLRTQGFMGDNGPARLHLAELVKRWNDTWTSPRLRVSRNEDFFVEAEARYGDELITVEGDWGDWWVEGVGSAAVPLALTREAQAAVTDASTFSEAAAWLGGEAVPDGAGERADTYDAISMFNEHTWGAGNSWTHGDEGFDSGERQWQWKVAQALAAHQRAVEFREHAMTYLGAEVPRADGALASYVAANATGHQRDAVVVLLAKEAHFGLDRGFVVRDGRSGTVLPHAVQAQSNTAHRESGRWVSVRVTDLPALGFVRLDIAEAPTDEARAPLSLRTTPRDRLLTLENDHLRVVVDEQTSSISSILDKRGGRELVNGSSVAGFNAYLYDQYGSSGAGFNHLANKLSVSDRLELLVSRSAAGAAILIERTGDAVEERLVYEFSADGVDSIRVTLRLRHGDSRLLIENRLTKPATRIKESGYFAFPFAVDEPVVHFEVSGGVTGDGISHIPGAPQHMRAIRNWVTIRGADDRGVVWVTKDAPLVQAGSIAVPYSPFPASTSPVEPATIFSWIHNNVWDTNFPIEQAFTSTFSYAVGVGTDEAQQSLEGLALATTSDLVHPITVTEARGDGAREPRAAASLLDINDDRVQLVSVVPAQEPGVSLVRLQSFAADALEVSIEFAVAVNEAWSSTYLGDRRHALAVDGRRIRVPLRPYETIACAVRWSAAD